MNVTTLASMSVCFHGCPADPGHVGLYSKKIKEKLFKWCRHWTMDSY